MFGILKHIKGTYHNEDWLIWDPKSFRVLKYKYKESAEYMAAELSKRNPGCTYTVVRLDDEHIS